MTKSTITKFCGFVIFFAIVLTVFYGCSAAQSGNFASSKSSRYNPPVQTGKLANPEITESSGLAASKCQPNVFWTHNDSGDDAFIYATDAKGKSHGTWFVMGAANADWEDIAEYKDDSGKCFLYIGEIGDNQLKRDEHTIYRVKEPRVSPADINTTKKSPDETDLAGVLRFKYPDGSHDAETLMVSPNNGDIYIVTKRVNGPAGVYRLKPEFGKNSTTTAEKIADVSMPAIPNGFVTGGDISPDGRRVIICDYAAAYEFTLPEKAVNFDDIWKQQPEIVDIGNRRVGEGVCYSPDGNAIYSSSEGKNAPIFRTDRKP